MTTGPPTLCFSCTRFVGGVEFPDDQSRCAAFPDGIPDAILKGGFDHRNPYEDDHGIHYILDPAHEPLLRLYERAFLTPH